MDSELHLSFSSNLASFIELVSPTNRHLTHLALVIHLQHSLPPNGNFPGSSPLLLPELSLRPLVAEHLHLAVRSVDQVVLPVPRILGVAVNL